MKKVKLGDHSLSCEVDANRSSHIRSFSVVDPKEEGIYNFYGGNGRDPIVILDLDTEKNFRSAYSDHGIKKKLMAHLKGSFPEIENWCERTWTPNARGVLTSILLNTDPKRVIDALITKPAQLEGEPIIDFDEATAIKTAVMRLTRRPLRDPEALMKASEVVGAVLGRDNPAAIEIMRRLGGRQLES